MKNMILNFGSNKKYYIAVPKPNALFTKFYHIDFYLNFFDNFQNEELIKKHKKFCKYSDYIDRVLPKKFKTLFRVLMKK